MIYMDNAATAFPRPQEVTDAVIRWLKHQAGSPGRGRHLSAQRANDQVSRVRRRVACFFGCRDEHRLVFTYSATDALNLAIKGFVKKGDHVLISAMEHNSVLRPLRHLEQEGTISLDIVPCDRRGYLREEMLWLLYRDNTRLVVLNHASNVTGAVQDVSKLGAEIRRRGAYLLLDAAQSAGNIPVDIDRLQADMIAFAGHKGLYGLPGTGGLIIGERIKKLRSWRQGGTGFNSLSEYQPVIWPEAFEAGTMNMPGIISMGCGIEFIEEKGLEEIGARQRRHLEFLWEALSKVQGVQLYGPEPNENRIAVLSFTIEGWEPNDIADILQYNYHIQVRSGLHCAPLAHKTLGTMPEGTVRLSPGYFTRLEELKQVVQAVKNIAVSGIVWQ
ncbi:MAG: aminotransferase class V-fold PLP-dependent enzyme [Dethiobacteria bacterium]|jgi:cysteine desulfurase family protein|nr:aminotransferase class V-fold PLP-dependent enzyme [Bacillota bacterium]